MKTADIVSSALVTLFGAALLLAIIPAWIPVESGPGFGLAATTMPNVAAATATALAAAFLIYRLSNRHPRTAADEEYDATPPIGRKNWMFLLRGGVFLVVVTVLFNWLGFLVAGPPTVAGFMIMMGERKPWHIGFTAVGATAGIWRIGS